VDTRNSFESRKRFSNILHKKIDIERLIVNGGLMSYVSRLWLTIRFKVDYYLSGMTGSIPTYCYKDIIQPGRA